jgi:hypothetical protein
LSFEEFISTKGFTIEKEFTIEEMRRMVLGGVKEEFSIEVIVTGSSFFIIGLP